MPEGAEAGPKVSQTPFPSLGVPGEPLCCQQGSRGSPFYCHGHSGLLVAFPIIPGTARAHPGCTSIPGCSRVCSQHPKMVPLWLGQRLRVPVATAE